MMKKLFLIALMLIFIGFSAQSQHKFGDVSFEELELEVCEIDPEAEAEFISKTCESRFAYNENIGWTLHREVTARLKVYNKNEAEKWANMIISLYRKENLINVKALTHNIENGKIVSAKINKKDIYTEEVNERITRKRFTFPNVKDGSVLEWTYTITSPYLREIDVWYFQNSIPIRYSSFEITIPEYFYYLPHFTGLEYPIDINHSRGTDGVMMGIKNYTFSTSISKYVYENVPALKDESFVFNINNFRNSVRLELSKVKQPGQIVNEYSITWKSIGKELMDNDHFGVQLGKSNYYKTQFKELNPQLIDKSVKEQMEIIFSYVQNSIHWNHKRGLFTDEGVKDAFIKKSGNTAEINLILVSLLREAGLNANPLVLSTVDNGVIGYPFPSITKLNYVIAAVEDGEDLYLLDASSKFSNINVLPKYCLNYQGVIIYKDNFKEVNIENSKLFENTSINYSLNENGEISGTYKLKEGGNSTIQKRSRLEKSEQDEIDRIQKLNSDILKEEIRFENINEKNEVLITDYTFVDNTSMQEIGGKLFFSPLLFTRQEENPFKKEIRLLPVEIGSPVLETCMAVFSIPENYTVEYLPSPIKYKLPEKMGEYIYMTQQINGEIHISKVLKLHRPIYYAQEAQALRQFFLKIVEKENEKIVLVKIE